MAKTQKQKRFNRSGENLGNIIALEHLNLTVPDQSLATLFYVTGLGLTRDPFVDFGQFNVWINSGAQQFHLPTGEPQVLRGEIGLYLPNIEHTASRLEKLFSRFEDTKFSVKQSKQQLLVTCPWGNKFRCSKGTAAMPLGIAYLEFLVPTETLPGIERFYDQVFKVPVSRNATGIQAVVGLHQTLRFKAAKKVSEYDGHHIAIYTPNFSGPYDQIAQFKQIMEESDQHQYRFKNIFDPETGDVLYKLEHEVRSLHHPMFNRNLTNRNSDQTFRDYVKGRDSFYPS